jgi:hypothetical protein
MSYPQPPGSGDPVPRPDPIMPYQPPQPYQQPQPDNPYHTQSPAPYGYGQPPQPYGYAQPQPQPYDYGYGAPAYGYPGMQPPRPTDGFAIAALVISCVSVLGLCSWGIGSLLGILGAVFGHVARRRIRVSGANGSGMALAGIIVGWVMTGLSLLFITFFIVMVASDGGNF